MSSTKLTPFSYVILALVGDGGAAPHDIVRMMRRGRMYWTAPDSQYYAEPKRLERSGHLRSRKEPGRTRERTVYELTAAGRKALRAWLATPASFPRIQHEPVVRLLAADMADEADVAAGLRGLREEIAGMYADLDEAEAVAREQLPARARYLALNHRLARRMLDAHVQWLDEVERELSPS
jgi:DNA-binding PadR family transcriptional regulator